MVEMLDAVAELVETGRDHAAGERGQCARRPADQPADGYGDQSHGRQGCIERAEEDPEIVRVLMVVEMYALPDRGGQGIFVQKPPVQDEPVQGVPNLTNKYYAVIGKGRAEYVH